MASIRRISIALLAAFLLWGLMFSPLTAAHVPFWGVMVCAALLLTGYVSYHTPSWWRQLRFTPANIALGVAMAAALWLAFFIGDIVAAELFPFARPEVSAIYDIRVGISPWLLSALLLFLIGPAEEIFWRGFIQEQLSRRWGANAGFVIATALYTAVHIPSCNMMLTLASCVAGGFWGLAYRLIPQRFTAILISHALWDAAVFIWFPIS